MMKHTHILARPPFLAFATWAVLGPVSAAAATPSAQDTARPVVTLERLLAETPRKVSGLRWLGDTHLVGDLKAGNTTVQTVWPLDGGPPSQLAPVEGGEISPDGKKFIAREKDDWVVRELQGERRELARVPGAYGDNPLHTKAWSRDSQQIALAQEARALAETPSSVAKENGVRVEDVGARADARDATGTFTSTMTVLDLRKPDAPRRYPFHGRLQAMKWGPADALYFVVQPYWDTGGAAPSTVVRVLRRDEQREVFRVGGIMQSLAPLISPDGRWMALVADVDGQMWDDFPSLLLLDLATGKQRRLTTDTYVSGSSVRWAPDSRALYFQSRDGGWSQLYRCDLDGNLLAITDTPIYKREVQLSPNGKLLAYAAYNGQGAVELRVVEVQTRHDRRVALLDDPATRYRFGKFERVKFPAPDGLNIAAWVIYPPDFDPVKKYPLYVDVHGGGPGSYLNLSAPLSMVVANGPLEWHAWAARGYLVFVPDYRSSGEYGPGVGAARYRKGDYGGIEADVRDVEAGTAWMMQRPYVDSSRVGVLGASAGGTRVNLLLTRSSRYRAGVMQDAIGAGVLPDFIGATTGAQAGTTGSRVFFDRLFGDISENPQAYLRGFLFDGYRSTTPTLIMIGGDRNAGALNPLSAEMLFSMLRRKGVPARMLRYVDDAHGLMTPASARHAFEQVASWYATQMNMATDDKGNLVFEGGRVKDARPVVTN